MRWILDDGPFGHLARETARSPEEMARWRPGVLLVAETTARAATPLSRSLLERTLEGEPIVRQIGIELGSDDPAEAVLFDLHLDVSSTTDLAEHESIAWTCVHGDDDTAFVCADRRAALTALAELGRGRVAHPFDVRLDLLARGWVSAPTCKRLCKLTHRHDQGLPRLPGRVRSALGQHK